MNTLTIYVDGSVTNDNVGGVGIRIISADQNGEEISYDSHAAGYHNVNSGQIEIIACRVALEEALKQRLTSSVNKVVILTDSKYVSENYKEAMFVWVRNRWHRKSGRPVPDAHLWKDLLKVIKEFNNESIYVDIHWIKGHDKDEHNIAVDEMAKKAARLPKDLVPKDRPITMFQPKKVLPSKKIEIGCVGIEGQGISVKILSGKFLKPQNIWCYQYEVISRNSPYRGYVDQIYSSLSLDPDHSYYVRLNNSQCYPRIEKLYWEIK